MPEYDPDLDNPDDFYIKPGGMFYIIKDEDEIIGTIGIINRGNNLAEFKRFYVDPSYRGKGYGSKLLKKAIEFCKENKFKKIEFESGKKFKDAHKFYQKRGFKIVKEDERGFYMEQNL